MHRRHQDTANLDGAFVLHARLAAGGCRFGITWTACHRCYPPLYLAAAPDKAGKTQWAAACATGTGQSNGNGDAADAERVRLAIVSNVGALPLSREDRKHIAEYLYGSKEWTMEAIAKALRVGFGTVARDLSNLSRTDKSKPAKTATNPKGAGRPKGTKKWLPWLI
jgi:hypothetical protein